MRGEIELACNLHLDGHIEGRIRAEHAVRIGRDGQVTGDVNADNLTVAGKLNGSVEAKVVEIVEGGLIDGTVFCDELIIAKGGRFLGESKPLKNNVAPLNASSNGTDSSAQG
ncbi:polymer-forming cytoskeletal protein [Gallaecimonas sp. GXIMD1310]|uniref:bactofilin family protein n=1 Tax=Gallaecimonas sp. GXIMD1310 TaxID=3131926 RepID=UPI003250330A